MKMHQGKKTWFFFASIAEKKLYWVCRVELESHPHVCLLPGEWSFPSAPCVGIVFDRTVPAMSHLACFFCSYSWWIEYFLMCVGSILSFPSVSVFVFLTYPLPSVRYVWSKIIQSFHLHTTFHTVVSLLSNTTFLVFLFISTLIALLCGCVWLCVFPPVLFLFLPFLSWWRSECAWSVRRQLAC